MSAFLTPEIILAWLSGFFGGAAAAVLLWRRSNAAELRQYRCDIDAAVERDRRAFTPAILDSGYLIQDHDRESSIQDQAS